MYRIKFVNPFSRIWLEQPNVSDSMYRISCKYFPMNFLKSVSMIHESEFQSSCNNRVNFRAAATRIPMPQIRYCVAAGVRCGFATRNTTD
jgi:hypothetical protein